MARRREDEEREERFDEILTVRIAASQLRRLREEAKRAGTSEGALVRTALDWWCLTGNRYAGEVIAELTREVASRLAKVGGRRRETGIA